MDNEKVRVMVVIGQHEDLKFVNDKATFVCDG